MHQRPANKFINVTEEFRKEAAELKPGEYKSVQGFTLDDSISAFELGSATMDTGLNFVPYSQSLATVGVPQSADEILQAIDALFCREIAWVKGATLVQTIFSGVFVEAQLRELNNPERLESNYVDSLDPTKDLLAVYVLATLKSCGLVVNQILQAAPVVALEEEFHPNSSNWSLMDSVSLDQILYLVERALAHCQSVPSMRELGLRFELRAAVLAVFAGGVTRDHEQIDKALDCITRIVPSEPADHWFDKGIQARSDGVCLPQPLRTLEYVEAKAFLSNLLQQMREAFSGLLPVRKSADLLGFYLNFAKESHTPFLRALIKNQTDIQNILGYPASTWLYRDISELSYPALPELKATIASQCREEWEAFHYQAQMCYAELLTCLCMGRCRQRQVMFEQVASWDSVHVAAQALDRAIVGNGLGNTLASSGSNQKKWAIEFSSWVYHRKLQLMLWSFLMGFEQELFSPHESAAMYWYAKTLAAILVEQLSRLKLYFQEHNYRQSPGYHYLVAMEVEARCLEHLCTANWLLYIVLEHRGLVKGPKFSQSSAKLTFGLRVECFEAVGIPMAPTYEGFIGESKIYDDELALNTIKQNISGAQAFLKAISQVAGANTEVQKLKRSAFGLSAMVLKLSKNTVEKIEIVRNGNHPYFPVVVGV